MSTISCCCRVLLIPYLLLCLVIWSSAEGPFCTSPGTSSSPSCSVTSDNLYTGRAIAGSSGNGSLPSWINLTLAAQGQQLWPKYSIGVLLSAFYGLMSVLAMPDISDVLLFTNNSNDPIKTVERYLATSVQMILWLDAPISTDPVNNAFLTSISHVRALHISAAQRAGASAPTAPFAPSSTYANVATNTALWTSFHADLVASNIPTSQRTFSSAYNTLNGNPLPVNQFAQAVTAFGFMGYFVSKPSAVCIWNVSENEMNAFIHLWAIISYAIGIEDQFNICLQPDVSSTIAYMNDIQAKYYNPALFTIDHKAQVLLESILTVTSGFVDIPAFKAQQILLRYLRDIVGIPVPNMMAYLSFAEQLELATYDNVFVPSTKVPGFGQATFTAVETALTAGIIPFWGLQPTLMDRAENVYYNGSAGFIF